MRSLWLQVLCVQAAAQGYAAFQASTLNVSESAGLLGIPLSRLGGSAGVLEVNVTVDLAASTASASRYEFEGSTVRWLDGDETPKAVAIRVIDDEIYQPPEVVVLTAGSQRLEILLQPDLDGGLMVFTTGPPNGGNLTFKLLELPEGLAPSVECLTWAERMDGSSGAVDLEVVDGCSEDSAAVAGTDYSFLPAQNAVHWSDGELGRKCVLYNVPSIREAPSTSSLLVWPDAEVERVESLCFSVKLNGTAKLGRSELHFLLGDGGWEGAGLTRCVRGQACNFDFGHLNWAPGYNLTLQRNCVLEGCGAHWAPATSYNFTQTLNLASGFWFACRCFEDVPHAIHLLEVLGPSGSDLGSCTLGWAECSVRITGSGLNSLASQSLRVLHSCQAPQQGSYGYGARGADPPNGEVYVAEGMLLGGVATPSTYVSSGALWFNMKDPQAMSTAGPGIYRMCWCSGGNSTGGCSEVSDYSIYAGLLEMTGPTSQAEQLVTLGKIFQINITGGGLQPGDFLALEPQEAAKSTAATARHQTGCSGTAVVRVSTDDGYSYDFGMVTEQIVPPGNFALCWCRPGVEACSNPDHWQYVGPVLTQCGSGYFNDQGACESCYWPWDLPNEARDACETDPVLAVGLALMILLTTFGAFLFLCQFELQLEGGVRVTGRRIRIEDISTEGGEKLIMTSLGRHHLHGARLCEIFSGGSRFRVFFYQTNHFLLDGHQHRVRVLDAFRLEITDLSDKVFPAEASGGYLVLSIPGTFWYSHLLQVPVLVWINALMLFGYSCAGPTTPPALFVFVSLAFQLAVAIGLRLAYWKSLQYPSPMDRRVAQYYALLNAKNPTPKSCPRGAQRAVTAFQLFDLYEFFQAFIKERNMYYIDPNIVRPLTKRRKLSFAERVGPSLVDYFISHWWGTPFVNFCEAVRRHAIHMSQSEDEGQWKKIAYWICTFSNNQYRVHEELGGHSHEESSFYLALHSDKCKGTAMIMDEEASLLKRSWCLFELLQTVRKSKSEEERKQRHEAGYISSSSRAEFKGMFFCTRTGVLNYGHATVELAMKIGENIKNLSLEHATATSQEDKDMINQLVLAEMGSYDKINQILRSNLAEALRKCQEEVDMNFQHLFNDLKGDNAEGNDLQHELGHEIRVDIGNDAPGEELVEDSAGH